MFFYNRRSPEDTLFHIQVNDIQPLSKSFLLCEGHCYTS